ncbi:patatin-like protein 1 [Glycine soja]|uniref:patatin-like protein 1 n=1 Tax=Glycine soja TaxID=3848 RepID=UPI000E21C088|nr:patatin-like protein 1 [Glycine soja]|eukprot:XP_025985002.1 patatin-like protein 1 [Glycine max]
MAQYFFLFVLVFASQLMAGFNAPLPLPSPSYGNHTTILSIDGGGIRGIIPATVLEYLDKALKAKDPTTSLAHYFDVISGTSTGGLMTAMLAAPNSSNANSPLFTPSDVVQFYKKYGPKIFEPTRAWYEFYECPKINGEVLHDITRKILKETRLNKTLTNVVIPTFDERKIKPVIFSNYKLKTETYLNAKLSDICIGTSAAPTYLPPHQFQNDGVQFDLVDGAMSANNPALVAVSEVIQHNEHKEILLLSLGTGTIKAEEKLSGFFDDLLDDLYDDLCGLKWLASSRNVFYEALYSTNMIHYYLATVFPGVLPADNYLRIEEYNLDPSMKEMDNADKENMDKLEKVGKSLLLQKALRMNVNTFVPVELDQTNAEALDRLSEKLYAERQLRLKRKSMEKGGSRIIESVKVPSGRMHAT